MSSCEKNFPVCAGDIDVTVTNFNATLKENGYGSQNGDSMEYVEAKVLTKVGKA
ncbi:hypothetical protein [Clostridium sp.]|uniref:hypothetical protein n=1 Tax=Clostridium sp. TaxID=1506 RepID=UPI002612F6B4|nr:hypothetical protein [Clostridium sp.]